MRENDWVCAVKGRGRPLENPDRIRHFDRNAVGMIKEICQSGGDAVVFLVSAKYKGAWIIPLAELQAVTVNETGDRHQFKICNTCHCLLPIDSFARNQNNVHGIVRRPACMQCRTDIDKRAAKSRQAKRMEANRPKKGDLFECPICNRLSIAGVTAKIVADHNHHTGNIRDYICDSCNTGLGRFKNGKNYLYNAIRYLEERDGK